MRLQDIALLTNTPLDTDPLLLEKFKSHSKVHFDSKTHLYSYKHDFSFRSKPALLTEIQRQTRKGSGISVRALKESWKEAPTAIDELEKEGEVLCTRTVKDGQLRMVFWNEIKPKEMGEGMLVEKEFLDLWHELKVPNDVDLLKQLENGASLSFSLLPYLLPLHRGSTSNKRRTISSQSSHCQKERKERWCSKTTASAHHKYSSKGRNRPIKRLSCTWEMNSTLVTIMISSIYPLSNRTTLVSVSI